MSKKGIKLILKTIGNRKGDCAWSCSRWQTQPEKICKLQSTNQYNVRSEWHWFVRCDLQIFSGCVCHLEQLHAQSPFLFPIVFSINISGLWLTVDCQVRVIYRKLAFRRMPKIWGHLGKVHFGDILNITGYENIFHETSMAVFSCWSHVIVPFFLCLYGSTTLAQLALKNFHILCYSLS